MTEVNLLNKFEVPGPRELMPKPSDALDAMIRGLRYADEKPNFAIDMDTYGRVRLDGCVGCAATFAVLLRLHEAGFEVPGDRMQRQTFLYARSEGWGLFESMINELRLDMYRSLLRYYNLDRDNPELRPEHPLQELDTLGWQNRIYLYEMYRDRLIVLGH